jgi:hypothetical protein
MRTLAQADVRMRLTTALCATSEHAEPVHMRARVGRNASRTSGPGELFCFGRRERARAEPQPVHADLVPSISDGGDGQHSRFMRTEQHCRGRGVNTYQRPESPISSKSRGTFDDLASAGSAQGERPCGGRPAEVPVRAACGCPAARHRLDALRPAQCCARTTGRPVGRAAKFSRGKRSGWCRSGRPVESCRSARYCRSSATPADSRHSPRSRRTRCR